MEKVTLAPDQEGYSFADPESETLRAVLDSGMGKYAIGVLNGAIPLNVQWTCDPDEYTYLQGVHAQHVLEGHAPFPIDLFIDTMRFVEHRVMIVPGTFGLMSQAGHQYVVGCSLLVEPIPIESFEGPVPKNTLPICRDGYSFRYSPEVVLTELEGGLPRAYRDQLGTSIIVNVEWRTSPSGFLYLRDHYRKWKVRPQEAFPIDLLLELPTVQEYNARYLPGTMKVGNVQGHSIVVTAQLEVMPAIEAPEECDCSLTAWHMNMENGPIVDDYELPMEHGVGTVFDGGGLPVQEPEGALYGTYSLNVQGPVYFTSPAVIVPGSWTMRFSYYPGTEWFGSGSERNLVLTLSDDFELPHILLISRAAGSGLFNLELQCLESEEDVSPDATFSLTQVHHIEVSFDYITAIARLFVNGTLIGTLETGSEEGGISQFQWASGSEDSYVMLDEVRVTNYVEHTESYTLDDLPFCTCTPRVGWDFANSYANLYPLYPYDGDQFDAAFFGA